MYMPFTACLNEKALPKLMSELNREFSPCTVPWVENFLGNLDYEDTDPCTNETIITMKTRFLSMRFKRSFETEDCKRKPYFHYNLCFSVELLLILDQTWVL